MAARKKDYNSAVQMYESGLSVQQISEQFSVTRQTIWVALKRRGVKFRTNLKFGSDNHFHRGTAFDGRAHDIVEKAVIKGKLIPQNCEVCGKFPVAKDGRRLIHAHHDDYNKPMEVRWLCQKHHHEWHKNNNAIPRNNEIMQKSKL